MHSCITVSCYHNFKIVYKIKKILVLSIIRYTDMVSIDNATVSAH